MQAEFWLERWAQNQIGFHNPDYHPGLAAYWDDLQVPEASTVFVPLCGKSLDLLWLRRQGYRIVAVELSRVAVEAFFAENDLSVSVSRQGELAVFAADGLTIYCGDFFALTAAELANVAGVYDRAALVALPPAMRSAYAAKMRELLPAGCRTLLVTFDYDQAEMAGPPFAVPAGEVATLYGSWCDVTEKAVADILDDEPRFRERGVNRIQESIYALTVR
ncbi:MULTISPECIES: thiopurine S-methyltransferase [Methylomonas]|uniref:Thiopurine S-methyltransferase n=1 Tax=Methylomonas koyamae TaxID=702114 RepID=A0A177N4D3_9GAMM|nr:thiopurine S-methyltransferase [Methylomonas koyamae]OAI12877.1 thiopurine S-methyltransferase [Methylomonas koyamae]